MQGIFDEQLARLYTAEIVLAIAHLHSLGFVHRDLKPVRVCVRNRHRLFVAASKHSCHLSTQLPAEPCLLELCIRRLILTAACTAWQLGNQ